MSEWFDRRLRRKAENAHWGGLTEFAVVVAGCVGFAYWQGSAGAGWFMFAALAFFDDAASQIALAIYAGRKTTP